MNIRYEQEKVRGERRRRQGLCWFCNNRRAAHSIRHCLRHLRLRADYVRVHRARTKNFDRLLDKVTASI